jgi:hypothetical protein
MIAIELPKVLGLSVDGKSLVVIDDPNCVRFGPTIALASRRRGSTLAVGSVREVISNTKPTLR